MKMVRTLGAVAALSIMSLSATSAVNAQQVEEQAQVHGKNGSMRFIELMKTGKSLETVTCHDFGLLDETFKPKAVVYAANYGPKGKPHPTLTVDGVENVMPLVLAECKARPGNHFQAAVHKAVAQAPVMK